MVELARGTEHGLSLGILTRDVYAGPQLAERVPSGTGSRHGGRQATIEAFSETHRVTLRGDLPAYPF